MLRLEEKVADSQAAAIVFGLAILNLGLLYQNLALVTAVLKLVFLVLLLANQLVLGIVFYRLTFHPLAKYPGPTWACITDWYNVYHCLKRDRHIDFYRLHQKYGPIVRFGPTRLSFNTNTALQEIYSTNSNNQKSKIYNSFQHFFKTPSSMTTIDKKAHGFKRRVNVQAIGSNPGKKIEDPMLNNIRLFCDLLVDADCNTVEKKDGEVGAVKKDVEAEGDLDSAWSSAKNISEIVNCLTSDIMGDVTFSKNWNMLKSKENRDILRILPEGVACINMSGYMPLLLTLKLDQIFFSQLVKDALKFKTLSKEQADWRASQSTTSLSFRDFWAALLEARDPETGHGFTAEALASEAGLLIVAGSDTMATGVTSTIFYLLHYPETLTRLQNEIRSKFKDVEEIRAGPELKSCNYITACLTEAMRLTPAVGGVLPREVLAGGMVIDNHKIPPGTDVGVPHYAIHHNEKYFPNPFEFQPNRWIVRKEGEGGVSDAQVALANSAYCPFSIGRASCIGRTLAYAEMSILLARIIWLFDMRIKPGSTVGEGRAGLGDGRERKMEFQTYDTFTSIHEGPEVQFKKAERG